MMGMLLCEGCGWAGPIFGGFGNCFSVMAPFMVLYFMRPQSRDYNSGFTLDSMEDK